MPESQQHNTGQGWKVGWVLRELSGGQIQEQELSEETTASHFKTKERHESLDLKSQKTEWKNETCKQTHRGQSVADKKERQESRAIRQE